MSDEDKKLQQASSSVNAETQSVDYENSPGKQLKKAREDLGLTQQQVADRLHLRPKSVKAVENDALEPGVSLIFSKGYVRLYAKLVYLEVQPLLDAYERIHSRSNQPAKLQSFSKRVSREADDHKWNMVTVVVALLVLGSVIGWWAQQSDSLTTSQRFVSETLDKLFSESEQSEDGASTSSSETDSIGKKESVLGLNLEQQDIARLNTGPEILEEDIDNSASNITNLSENEDSEQGLDANAEVLEQTDQTNQTNQTDNEANQQFQTAVPNIVNISPATSAKVVNGVRMNADGSINMAFTFKTDCWVSVKDVNNETIAIGIKKQGRVMEVSGLAPIEIILCTPDNVDIDFGGKAIDMSVYPSGQAANFTLTVES